MSAKRNTFILKCFLQFTCTNLDGSQKDEGNVLNLGTQKGGGGSLRKGGGGWGGGSNPGGNHGQTSTKTFASQMSVKLKEKVLHYGNFFRDLNILVFKATCKQLNVNLLSGKSIMSLL